VRLTGDIILGCLWVIVFFVLVAICLGAHDRFLFLEPPWPFKTFFAANVCGMAIGFIFLFGPVPYRRPRRGAALFIGCAFLLLWGCSFGLIHGWLASANRRSENVRITAVVISELKFGDIQRHIFGTHFVECADNAALEDRPKTLLVRADSDSGAR
jgi:hypothetical protein